MNDACLALYGTMLFIFANVQVEHFHEIISDEYYVLGAFK